MSAVKKLFSTKRKFHAMSVEQLKRYGYSAGILFGLFSMSTVLLFGSPTFVLSPATKTFDYYVYPILILLGLWTIRAILRGHIPIEQLEKPLVAFFALFFVSKFSLTLLAAPTVLPIAHIESWYWMMIGIWSLSFLAHTFYRALAINLGMYAVAVAATVTNVCIKLESTARWDFLSDVAASNLRLAAILTFVVVLGYIKSQWLIVEQEATRLRSIAHQDELTGLPNRRQLSEELQAAIEKGFENLTVILFDLDEFKEVNDQYGHFVGDDVLRHISTLARNNVRSDDTVGRWGGEEFLIICPNTTLAEGVSLAQRLRGVLASHAIPSVGPITGSFGVAELRSGESAEQLLARADKALYAAKQQGRNQVFYLK